MGAVAGGLTAAALLRRMPEGMMTALGLSCAVLAVLLLTLPSLVLVLTGMLLAGFVAPWVIVAATTAIQRRTPWAGPRSSTAPRQDRHIPGTNGSRCG